VSALQISNKGFSFDLQIQSDLLDASILVINGHARRGGMRRFQESAP
jgi:hypothetical protein